MAAWLIGTLIFVWFIVPAFVIIVACMHASRLSQAEEAARIAAQRKDDK